MKINEWIQDSRDDLLDESTIELFRQYLQEVMNKHKRSSSLCLRWSDN